MKHSSSLTIALVFASLVIAPNHAEAVDVISQSFEIGGSSSTTNSVFESTTTIDNYPRNRRRQRQPTVIIQQNNIYPQNSRSNCTMTIIGSPIPSPIPLDRTTGQPCR